MSSRLVCTCSHAPQLETHKYWPEAFKEMVRELLRAHHVVARRAAAGQQLALDPPPMAPR